MCAANWSKKSSLKKNSYWKATCNFIYCLYAWLRASDNPSKYQDLLKVCIHKLKCAPGKHLLELVVIFHWAASWHAAPTAHAAHPERNPVGKGAWSSVLLWVARGFSWS